MNAFTVVRKTTEYMLNVLLPIMTRSKNRVQYSIRNVAHTETIIQDMTTYQEKWKQIKAVIEIWVLKPMMKWLITNNLNLLIKGNALYSRRSNAELVPVRVRWTHSRGKVFSGSVRNRSLTLSMAPIHQCSRCGLKCIFQSLFKKVQSQINNFDDTMIYRRTFRRIYISSEGEPGTSKRFGHFRGKVN